MCLADIKTKIREHSYHNSAPVLLRVCPLYSQKTKIREHSYHNSAPVLLRVCPLYS